jgi:hypothetical protein
MKQIILNHLAVLMDKLIGNLATDASADKKDAYGVVLLELHRLVKVIKSL